MKILIINSLRIYGGGEYFVYLLATQLKTRGYDVYVSCPLNTILHKKCIEAGIKFIELDFPEKNEKKFFRNILSWKKIFKQNDFDIIQTTTNYDRTIGAFAKSAGSKHIAAANSLLPISHNLTHWLRNKWFTDHFVTCGESAKELLSAQDGIRPDRISVVYLGLPGKNEINDMIKQQAKEKLGINQNVLIIGNVSRMTEFKGQQFLIKALRILSNTFDNVKLVITGDGELKESLLSLTKELCLEDKVIFTGFREDLDIVYPAFDIYVQPSISGGGELFPLSVLNALSFGLPVVTTDTGDIVKMAVNNKNALIVKEKSPDDIADKLSELINDKEKRLKMGKASIRLFEEKFTADKMTDNIEAVYRKILN